MITDWTDLQTVMAIARNGTLSAAARALSVSQSTVSRRLQAIEYNLDQQVFVRTADGRFVPTEMGHVLAAAGERMDAAFNEANAAISVSVAPIRIASCEVIARAILSPALSEWTRQTGIAVDLAVHDDLFETPQDAYDIMVTPFDSAPENLTGRCVARLYWGIFASSAYLAAKGVPGENSDLGNHDVIRSSGSLADVSTARWFAALGGRPSFFASSPSAQLEAAASGGGIALLPVAIAATDPRVTRIPRADAPVSEVWMVARRSVATQPTVRRFLDWSRRFLARDFDEGRPIGS